MAKRTPRNKAPRIRGTEDDIGMSRFGSQVDDDGDEDDDDGGDEDDADEDRGDDHEGSDDEDDDDEGDGDGDDEGSDDDDGDDEGDDGDGDGDEGGAAASLEELQRIANENNGTVPLARLNEVLERNRRLEDFILSGGVGGKQAEQKADDTPPFDLRAKIKERNSAILDGDDDRAADLDLEIEQHRQEEADRRADAKVQARFEQQAAKAAGDAVVAAYPELETDEESLELVMHTRNLFIAKGMPAAEAIIKAAEKIMGPAPKARDVGKEQGKSRIERKREDLRRHRQIPPTTHRTGSGSRSSIGDIDVARMSDRKFNALDKREKAEARGDFVGGDGKTGKRLRRR